MDFVSKAMKFKKISNVYFLFYHASFDFSRINKKLKAIKTQVHTTTSLRKNMIFLCEPQTGGLLPLNILFPK